LRYSLLVRFEARARRGLLLEQLFERVLALLEQRLVEV
jgi:hypothetical protein